MKAHPSPVPGENWEKTEARMKTSCHRGSDPLADSKEVVAAIPYEHRLNLLQPGTGSRHPNVLQKELRLTEKGLH